MCGRDVVDFRRALIVIDEQVQLDGRCQRGLAVLSTHDPEHFAVLPLALDIDEAEDDRQDCPLEQLQLEGMTELAGRQPAEALDEVDVLRRVFLAEMVRVQRV